MGLLTFLFSNIGKVLLAGAIGALFGLTTGMSISGNFCKSKQVGAYEQQIQDIERALDAGRDAVDDVRANGLRDEWYRD